MGKNYNILVFLYSFICLLSCGEKAKAQNFDNQDDVSVAIHIFSTSVLEKEKLKKSDKLLTYVNGIAEIAFIEFTDDMITYSLQAK